MKYKIVSLLYFLAFGILILQGQHSIVAKVAEGNQAQGESKREFIVKWSQSQADAWKAEFLPVLEAYPVTTDIDLSYSTSTEQRNQVLVSLPFDAKYAFQISTGEMPDLKIFSMDGLKLLYHQSKQGKQKKSITPFLRGSSFLFSIPSGELSNVLLEKIFVRERFSSGRDLGFDGSLECEENVACLQDNPWELQSRSVVRIRMVMNEGIGWCTGSLMNNTAKDGRSFILSAHHCQSGFNPIYDSWRFDFGYESTSCQKPAIEPGFQSLTGCVLRAKGQDSDFLLIELLDEIPVEYNVYYNGWNHADDYLPDTVALIHHPSADIKKVSIDYNPSTIFPFNIHWDEGITTPSKYHYKSFFDLGTHEGGSSGAPLIDQDGFVIGQLHGGRADCEENFGYSGRIHKSWDSGSLEDEILGFWLDPLGTGQDTLHGMLHPDLGSTFSIHGVVKDAKGHPMKNVVIKVEGDLINEIQTDTLGQFTLPVVSRSANITLKPRKNTVVANGVTAIDLLLIQKHLLNIKPFTETYELLAADVSGNDKVTGTDLILIQKLLLGINSAFPGRQSWTFDPVSINFSDITEPSVELEIMGIKLGDVNGTADGEM